MSGLHLGLQQDRRISGCAVLQPGNPFRRLGVEDAGVVERGDRQDLRVRLGVDVLIRRVRLHVLVDRLVCQRVSPLVPLDDGEWQRRIEDGRQRIHERDHREYAVEQLGRQVRDRADQQAAGATALTDQLLGGGDTGVDQMLCSGDKIGEGVLLGEGLTCLVPMSAHLTATADMGDDKHDAAVEQRQP